MHADSGQRAATATIRNNIAGADNGASSVGCGVVQGKAVVVFEQRGARALGGDGRGELVQGGFREAVRQVAARVGREAGTVAADVKDAAAPGGSAEGAGEVLGG